MNDRPKQALTLRDQSFGTIEGRKTVHGCELWLTYDGAMRHIVAQHGDDEPRAVAFATGHHASVKWRAIVDQATLDHFLASTHATAA